MKTSPDAGEENLFRLATTDDGENSLDGLLDEMDDAIGDFLDEQSGGRAGGDTPKAAGDWGEREMEETFLALLRSSLKPVTRYIKALENMRHTPPLYEIIDLTVAPMARMARDAELGELSGILATLADSCRKAAAANGDHTRRHRLRRQVIEQYEALSQRVDIGYRGHRPAVLNLLRFYKRVCREPNFRTEDIRRFFAVGIPSVSWVSRTPATEITSLSGISHQGVRRLKTISRRNGRKIGLKNAGLDIDLNRLSKLSTKL